MIEMPLERPRPEVVRVRTREQLQALASRLGVGHDWHEPDNQGVSAVVFGHHFDNAGFWALPDSAASVSEELWVALYQEGEPVAEVNLATLFAFACGTYSGS